MVNGGSMIAAGESMVAVHDGESVKNAARIQPGYGNDKQQDCTNGNQVGK